MSGWEFIGEIPEGADYMFFNRMCLVAHPEHPMRYFDLDKPELGLQDMPPYEAAPSPTQKRPAPRLSETGRIE